MAMSLGRLINTIMMLDFLKDKTHMLGQALMRKDTQVVNATNDCLISNLNAAHRVATLSQINPSTRKDAAGACQIP